MSDIIIKEGVDLSRLNTYRTGGSARYLISPNTDGELIQAINYADKNRLKFQLIGAGSNILISDNGYDGVIILLTDYNNFIKHEGDIIKAGAGVSLNKLINFAIENGCSGLEMLSGIPGLLGGGVKMNAGAYGVEFKDFILSADVITEGAKKTLSTDDIGFRYRDTDHIDDSTVISSVNIKVSEADSVELSAKRSEVLKLRSLKQPLDKPSCGSVFKRPKVGYAGEYIEKAGLKGFRYNGAMISDKHANFILNYDNAKSSDIKFIIDTVIDRVYKEFNIILEREVKLIGDFI